VVPMETRLVLRDGLAGFAKAGLGVVVRPPFARQALESLRRYARGGKCRIVVRAEGGLTFADLAALESIGPCFFELHLASDPSLFADRLGKLRPLQVVWEAGPVSPDVAALAKVASLPQPVVAVDEDAVLAAAGALARLDDERLTLLVRARHGELGPATWKALEDPRRRFRVWVVALDGLDPFAARRLRSLSGATVELALERVRAVPPGLFEAAAALSRPVDAPGQRPLSDADADAPLLHFDPVR
jgi:hypothetical protein